MAKRTIIFGSPGTGKTRTLTEIIYDQVTSGTNPEDIVALSFSNAAAKELAGRNAGVFCSTMHAYSNMLHKSSGDDRKVLSHTNKADFVRAVKNVYPEPLIREALTAYDLSRANLSNSGMKDSYKRIIDKYEEFKLKYRLLDFADMLTMVKPSPGGKLLALDEMQDMSAAQWKAVSIWTPSFDRVIACGDPDQAIYRFAGASAMGMLNFMEGTEVVNLDKGYRVPSKVHDFCIRIAKVNPDRIDRPYAPVNQGGEVIKQSWYSTDTERLPPQFKSTFLDMFAKDDDNLILSRTNRELGLMADTLDELGISYHPATINPNSNLLAGRMWKDDAIYAAYIMEYYLSSGKDVPPKDHSIITPHYPSSWLTVDGRPRSMDLCQAKMADASKKIIRSLLSRYGSLRLAHESNIKLSTYHGSKGLESKNVTVWLRYPKSMLTKITYDANLLFEEVSCLYVACSRSLSKLTLIKCGKSPLTGKVNGF